MSQKDDNQEPDVDTEETQDAELPDEVAPELPPLNPEAYFESLMAVVEEHSKDRQQAVEAIATVEEWSERRRHLEGALREMMGEFPERGPLNARVMDRTAHETYSMERVVFESRPRFYVTANFYLPSTQSGPVPGVLVPCGHAAAGKACETYQRVAIHLAMKGFAVFVYDPIGQGERVQYWEVDGSRPLLGPGTAEHFADGNLSYLLGMNLAQFRVWDGMRALDYLCSRPEVDSTQLGCTGNSGGGTLTTYLAALDHRLKAAAPCCYVTTLRQRFLSRQIADPEQNLLPIIAAGMELADLLALFAPKPLLLGAAQDDFFPIEGTRVVYQELRKLYHLLGVEERVTMVEVPEEHGWTLGLRQAACAWMIRWLGATEHSPIEPEFDVIDEADTWCFPEGKLYLHVRGSSVSDILAYRMRELHTGRSGHLAGSLSSHDREVLRDRVRRAIRCEGPEEPASLAHGPVCDEEWGTSQELHLATEANVVVPATLHLPADHEDMMPGVVLAHSRGRSELGAENALGAALARAGIAALCVDPRGVGEACSQLDQDPAQWWRDRDAELAYVALMTGIVPLGRRVYDLWCGVEFLRSLEGVDADRLGIAGYERAGIWTSHLSALLDDVAFAVQVDSLACYECLFSRADYRAHVADFVPRALLEYDLPQVVALTAPKPQLIVNPKGAAGEPASEEEIDAFFAQARGTYDQLDAGGRLIVASASDNDRETLVVDWIRRVTQP